MKCVTSTHERLAERLVSILTKLNVGHQLSIPELAQEFKVSTRTIERDFDRLNAYLPLLQDKRSKNTILMLPIWDGLNFRISRTLPSCRALAIFIPRWIFRSYVS